MTTPKDILRRSPIPRRSGRIRNLPCPATLVSCHHRSGSPTPHWDDVLVRKTGLVVLQCVGEVVVVVLYVDTLSCENVKSPLSLIMQNRQSSREPTLSTCYEVSMGAYYMQCSIKSSFTRPLTHQIHKSRRTKRLRAKGVGFLGIR